MFIIQCLDHDEGSCAQWHDIIGSKRETKELTREYLKNIREKDNEWCSLSYRIVEVDSDLYYSQPSDKLEY